MWTVRAENIFNTVQIWHLFLVLQDSFEIIWGMNITCGYQYTVFSFIHREEKNKSIYLRTINHTVFSA